MVIWVYLLIQTVLSCDLPDLPPLLTYFAPSYENTKHIEASGRYLAPSESLTWDLYVSEDSWFRLTAEPKLHDLQISLLKGSTTIVSSQSLQDEYVMISNKLVKGTYSIVINVVRAVKTDESDAKNSLDCALPNMYFNLALHPYYKLKELLPESLDEYHEGYPDISEASQTFETYMPYTSTFSTYLLATSDIPMGDSVLKTFEFENPEISEEMKEIGLTGLWKVTFSLHHDFLTGGGLGLIFSKFKTLPNQLTNLGCIKRGSCIFGRRVDKNAVTIYSGFGAGKFSVAIFYASMTMAERDMLNSLGGNIPYSLHVSVEPIIQREDRFNCEAAHIPHSLNTPGLLDSNGFLRYSDKVIADFLSVRSLTEFKLTKASVLRVVTVEPSGIDVDIILRNSFGSIIARSNAIGESEGILKELEADKYTLEFSILNSVMADPRHKFCETFILEIGISPNEAVKGLSDFLGLHKCKDDNQELRQKFSKVSSWLNSTTAKVDLSTPANSYHKVALSSIVKGEEEVFTASFYIPIHAYCYFDIYSDFVINDFTIQIYKSIKKTSEIVYGDTSDSLSIGGHDRRSFQGELRPGNYIFKVKTGPTSKDMSYSAYETEYVNTNDDFAILPHCGAFQIRGKILATTDEKLQK